MRMIDVNSSNISSVGYERGALYVKFNRGQVYAYYNVPESVFLELLRSSSCGEYFANHIKSEYQYERIS